ncbi:uncharacterized protein LOC126925069 [Bombus affinis]|uniref:uncharacterized protein LOC126925069 n=1 Tax=Bombus affinis TaxID=309941 RepID=UPI0021B7D23D|nr:uncharacterized protein LOC126925069 [Bombus affinis]
MRESQDQRTRPHAVRLSCGTSTSVVTEGVETLSNHLYIFMEVKFTLGPGTVTTVDGHGPPRRGRARPPPRWKFKERGDDQHRAAAVVAAWNWEASATPTETSVEKEAENFRRVLTAICDTSMSRTTLDTVRSRAVYWWTPDIAELRKPGNDMLTILTMKKK